MLRLKPLGVEEQRPAGAETLQCIIGAGAETDQFGFGRAFEVRTAKAEAALETAVLVQHNARRDQCRPGQQIGKTVGLVAIFANVQHRHHPR